LRRDWRVDCRGKKGLCCGCDIISHLNRELFSMPSINDEKLRRLRQWQSGGTPGPYELIVYPTNRCNLKCAICWERHYEALPDQNIYRREDEVPDDRYLRLVEEAAALDVRWWSFIGGGEPMLRAELVLAMAEKIRDYGMNGVLHTNGTTLKEAELRHFNRIGWSDITLSLDGPSAEINDAIRFRHSFERATRAALLLLDIRDGNSMAAPRLALNTTLTRLNADHLPAMAETAARLGCHRIGFSRLIVYNADQEQWRLTAEQEARLPEEAARAAEKAEALGLGHNLAEFSAGGGEADAGLPDVPDAGAEDSPWLRAACYEVWLTAAVTADGRTGPCCVFYDEAAQSIKEHSLREVWLGPYFTEIRARILSRKLMGYCAQCPSSLLSRSADLRAHLIREVEPLPARLAYLAGRFRENLRRRGLRGAINRTREWLRGRGI
jgi:MoaA/NifB/PqqE/SkfB family radical SAM enzyme